MFIHTQNYTLNKTVFPARSKTQQKVYSFPTGSTKAKNAAVTELLLGSLPATHDSASARDSLWSLL